MSKFLFFRCAFFVLVIATTTYVSANPQGKQFLPERVVWDKRPIVLHIQKGHERIVHFPDDIRYWLPDSLKRKVTALAANGVLYLQASSDFSTTRIRVQGLNNNQVYLLDVSADNVVSSSDTLIVMQADSVINHAKETSSGIIQQDWKIRLTRYAAQQLYAPERLVFGDSAIKQLAVDAMPMLLVRGGLLQAEPIATWQGGDLFVTAIKLTNLSRQTLQLTFNKLAKSDKINLARQIRGRWLAATLQHHDLQISGNDADSTTLYLVSKRPFIESLKGVGHG